MKFLIIYGTTEGQTRKIARFMKEVLLDNGHQVMLADASEVPEKPNTFDAILIGGSVHGHKYQSAISHYISDNLTALNQIPGAFFSVSLAAAPGMEDEHQELQKITAKFLAKKGWKPLLTTELAGALKYTQYDYLKRLIMKLISRKEGQNTDSSQDYEYTDWDTVKLFVNKFEHKVMKTVNER